MSFSNAMQRTLPIHSSSSSNNSMIKEELTSTLNELLTEEPTTMSTTTTPTSSSSSSSLTIKDGTNLAAFKLLLLTLMVVQNSSTVLVGRYTRSTGAKEDLFVVNHLVLITEVAKLIISCVFEFIATNGNLLTSIRENNFDRPMDALKISIPALLYLVQNTLLYIALSNLSAPLFQVTYQAKLVTTAIVSVLMLGRKYNPKQWLCLVGLSLGVAIVVLGETKPETTAVDASKPTQSLAVGMVAITIACFCSALAGVYFEKVLKFNTSDKDGKELVPVSVWMRNCQLAFFSCLIAIGQQLSSEKPSTQPYLHGFTSWVWVLVLLQAGGGLLVAAVIKYADNVLKGLATGVSVVAATVFSLLVFGTPLSNQFSLGAGLILVAVYFFSNNVPSLSMCVSETTMTNKKMDGALEMQPILPK